MKNFNRKLVLSLTTLCLSIAATNLFAEMASNMKSISIIDTHLGDSHQSSKYVRKSVFSPNNVDLVDYQLAVKLMKELPKTDKRNWYFQSGIHGYFNAADKGNESKFIQKIALKPEDFDLYSKKTMDGKKTLAFYKDKNGNPTDIQAWDICHRWGANSDLFLLWHRVYVYSFENIARKLLSEHEKRPSNFALPYWDYTDLDSQQKSVLPTVFHSPRDNSNPLYVLERSFEIQTIGMNSRDLDIKPAFEKTNMWAFSNTLERGVHGYVHDKVGNPKADDVVMGEVQSAAQDPIFWLHHSNIDRLWSCWNRKNKNTPFPDNGKKYAFIQPDGSIKEYSVKDMQNLVDNMDYEFESYKDCSFPNLVQSSLSSPNSIKFSFKNSVEISNKEIEIPIQTKGLQKNLITSSTLKGGKLNLINITSHSNMRGLYEVYLKSSDIDKEVYLNAISFFGFHSDHDHPSSFSRELDANDAIANLLQNGADINNFKVVIKPDSRLTQEEQRKLNQEFQIGTIELIIDTTKQP